MFLASALVMLSLTITSPASAEPAGLRFEDITNQVSAHGRARSREWMEAWVRAHPTDANAGRGLVWIAELYVADGRRDAARPYYERAAREYPDTEWGRHGVRGMAELDLAHRHYAAALKGYKRLASTPLPLWSYVGRTGIAEVRGERIRFVLFLIAALALVAFAAIRVWLASRAGDRIWRLPEECTYPLPIFVLMIAAAFNQPADEAIAVIVLAVGGFLLLWGNGVYRRARPPRGTHRLGEAILALVQTGALFYCVLIVSNVWHKFHDTIVMGAE
jgi:hypothetical protein